MNNFGVKTVMHSLEVFRQFRGLRESFPSSSLRAAGYVHRLLPRRLILRQGIRLARSQAPTPTVSSFLSAVSVSIPLTPVLLRPKIKLRNQRLPQRQDRRFDFRDKGLAVRCGGPHGSSCSFPQLIDRLLRN